MKHYLICVALSVSATAAYAQSTTADICLSMADKNFLDTSNNSILTDRLSEEFDNVCSSEYGRAERFNNTSAQMQARYGLFKGRGGFGSQSGSLEEQISSACDIGTDKFRDFLRNDSSISTGSSLAGYITECAQIVAQSDRTALFGSFSVSAEDDRFVVRVTYEPGQQGLTYRLSQIEGDDVNCTISGNTEAVGNVVMAGRSERLFTCTKPKGRETNVGFVFEPSMGASLSFQARVPSSTVQVETMQRIRDELEDRISDLEGSGKILAIGKTERCVVDRVVGKRNFEQACVFPVSLPGKTTEYDVMTSLVMYDFPGIDGTEITQDNLVADFEQMARDQYLKAPVYMIETVPNPQPETGFDIVVNSAYHHANNYQVNYIVVAK
ncbi:MAG: hypothetical protein AAGG56_11535 [Pseudomonadota bacterium]